MSFVNVGPACAQILSELDDIEGDLSSVKEDVEDADHGLAVSRLDRGKIEHTSFHRPRPSPYDTTVVGYLVSAHVNPDTFGLYAQLIAVGTYDFGDTPNCVQIKQLVIEAVPANDTYILEFYRYDGVTYEPVGAIRFLRAGVFPRSWTVEHPCRCFNNDTHSLHARLKSKTGGNNVNISLSVARMLHTDYYVPFSSGVWPTG